MRRSAIRRRPPPNHLSRAEWEHKVALLLGRSGGMCEARTPDCVAPGGSLIGMDRRRVSVQHRRAQGMGGTDRVDAHGLANLLLICGDGVSACHGWIETQQRESARLMGFWVRHDRDGGAPVPVHRYPVMIGCSRWWYLDSDAAVYVQHPDPYGLAGVAVRELA